MTNVDLIKKLIEQGEKDNHLFTDEVEVMEWPKPRLPQTPPEQLDTMTLFIQWIVLSRQIADLISLPIDEMPPTEELWERQGELESLLKTRIPETARAADRAGIDPSALLAYWRNGGYGCPDDETYDAALNVLERVELLVGTEATGRKQPEAGNGGQPVEPAITSAVGAKGGEQPVAPPKPKRRLSPNTVELLLGEESREILGIAQSDKSADAKMRTICGIDHRYLAWDSEKWAELLGVKGGAIRKTEFWKRDRKLAIESDRDLKGQ